MGLKITDAAGLLLRGGSLPALTRLIGAHNIQNWTGSLTIGTAAPTKLQVVEGKTGLRDGTTVWCRFTVKKPDGGTSVIEAQRNIKAAHEDAAVIVDGVGAGAGRLVVKPHVTVFPPHYRLEVDIVAGDITAETNRYRFDGDLS